MAIESDVELKAQAEQATQQKQVDATKETQKEATEVVEPEKAEAAEVAAETTDESAAPENEEVETEESQEKDKPEKTELTKNAKKRIDKLVKERSRAREERDYWRSEALKKVDTPKADTEVEKPKSRDGKPNPDDFKTHEEYLDARDEWNKREWKREADRDALKSREKTQADDYQRRAREFAKGRGDWDEVIEEIKDIQPSITVYKELLESENGPELYYELAKRPDEYKRICALGPIAAARELGKFEANLSRQETSEKPETKKITKAPKPPTPVGTKSAHTKNIYDTNLSQHEFERLRDEQIKQRKRA